MHIRETGRQEGYCICMQCVRVVRFGGVSSVSGIPETACFLMFLFLPLLLVPQTRFDFQNDAMTTLGWPGEVMKPLDGILIWGP